MSLTGTYNQLTSVTKTWIACFEAGYVYYGIDDPGNVYSISGGSATQLRSIGPGIVWGAVVSDGTYFYRATSNNILQLNASTGAVGGSASIQGVRCIALDKANNRIFALLNNGALYTIDKGGWVSYYVTNVGAATYGPKMAYLNNALYIPVYGGYIKKFNIGTGAVTNLTNSMSASWLCVDTDGSVLFASVDGGYIYQVDPTNTTQYQQILGDSTGRAWYALSYNADSVQPSLLAAAYNGYYYSITLPAHAKAPTASISTATFNYPMSVSLSCATSGATIKYTLDGTTPSTINGTVYSTPITISQTTTLKIASFLNGYTTQGPTYTYTYALPPNIKSIINDSGTWHGSYYYGGYIYASTATCVYKIDANVGTSTLLYSSGYRYHIYVDGSNIYLSSGSTITKLSIDGTLIGSLNAPVNSVSGFVRVGNTLYVFGYNSASTHNYGAIDMNTFTCTTKTLDMYAEIQGVANVNGIVYIIKNVDDLQLSVYTVDPSTGVTSIVGTTNKLTRALPDTPRVFDVTSDGTDIFFSCTGGGVYSLDIETMSISLIYLHDSTYGGYWGCSYCSDHNTIITSLFQRGIYEISILVRVNANYIYTGGSWKTPTSIYVFSGGSWKLGNKAYEVKNGLWNRII